MNAIGLSIEDTLSSPSNNPAEAVYHFHPNVRVQQLGDAHGLLILPCSKHVRWQVSGGAVRLLRSSWHPEFGLSLASQRLLLSLEGCAAVLLLDWSH